MPVPNMLGHCGDNAVGIHVKTVELSFARFRLVQSLNQMTIIHQIPPECTQFITKVDGNQPSILDTTLLCQSARRRRVSSRRSMASSSRSTAACSD